MDINGSRILILGGAGLVGMAITRRMLKHHIQIFLKRILVQEWDHNHPLHKMVYF